MSQRPSRGGLAALSLLVLARLSVSFQFQSIVPLLPLLETRFAVNFSELGMLLGLYMAPGVLAALSLPSLVARFGRRSTINAAFVFMVAGEILLWSAPSFGLACLARLLAGAGGCIIYIVTINMVADLANAGSPAARMGVIAASWPFGNAFALGALGLLISRSPEIARYAPVALVVISMLAIQSPLVLRWATAEIFGERPSLVRWIAVLRRIGPIALCFALYNIGFIILTGFSSRILIDDGFTPAAATAVASIPMWMFLISVPLGGFVAGRNAGGDLFLVAFGCVASAAFILASSAGVNQPLLYALAGLAGGLPTAAILARGRTMSGEGTDITYSALFSIFFAMLLILPPIVGYVADLANTTNVIHWIVAILLISSVGLFATSPPELRLKT